MNGLRPPASRLIAWGSLGVLNRGKSSLGGKCGASVNEDHLNVRVAKVKLEDEEIFPVVTQKCLNCGDAARNNQYCSHPCRLADWAEQHGEVYWNKLAQ